MANGINTFDDRSTQLIADTIRELRRRVISLERQLLTRHEANYKPARIYVAKTGGSGIPAATETDGVRKCGSGTVTFYTIASNDNLEVAVYTETVKNMAMEAVAADTYIQVKEEALTNKLLVDWEECG